MINFRVSIQEKAAEHTGSGIRVRISRSKDGWYEGKLDTETLEKIPPEWFSKPEVLPRFLQLACIAWQRALEQQVKVNPRLK